MPPKKKKPKEGKVEYEVHRESFEGKPVLILCRAEPGRCPLLGLCNFLLLRQGGTALLETIRRNNGTTYVTPKKLQGFVLDQLRCASAQTPNAMSGQQSDELLKNNLDLLKNLCSEIRMYEQFSSVKHFRTTLQMLHLLNALGINRRHALLPDPVKDARIYSTIKEESSFNLLAEYRGYIEGCEEGKSYEQSYHENMGLIEGFVKLPFTKYGLDLLCEEALEKELFLLLLNRDLHVVYKRDGQLYLLATQQDVRVKYPDIMWFGLDENFNAENENGVQQMDDPILIDLIMEQDLKGLLTEAIKLMMQNNNFEGRFQTTWQHFSGSEPKDDGDSIPLCFGAEDVEVAKEPGAAGMQAAAIVPRAESLAIKEPERFVTTESGMKLTEEGLRSVDGGNWILDEVINFVYDQLNQEFKKRDGFFLVLPSVAHALANVPEGSQPSDYFDPGNNNLFLFPVNNSDNHELGDGGTHWSLLVLRVDRSHNECIFVHHDSSQNANQAVAVRLVRNLEKLFPKFHSRYKLGQTPQQANGYDCGMHVICISHEILKWYKKVKDQEKAAEDWIADVSKVTSQLVSKTRTKLSANLKKLFQERYPDDFEEESSNQGSAVE